MAANRPLSIFISYTRADFRHADNLWQHLADFRGRQGASVFFDKKRTTIGEPWLPDIRAARDEANLFVLLLSKDFVNSEFCINEEVRVALKRMGERTARIFVVLIGAGTYDQVPENAPGSRYLGEATVQRVDSSRLLDLQAAGPFDPSGRLLPMNMLREPEQDMAWQQIIDRIYDHFGLRRIQLAEREVRSRPAASTLEARCDRTRLVDRIVEMAGESKPGVLGVIGHRLGLPLVKRIERDLESRKPPVPTLAVSLKRAANCRTVADFDHHLLNNAATGVESHATPEQVLDWAAANEYKLLLVTLAIGGANVRGRLRDAKLALHAASHWAALRRLALQDRHSNLQIVVLIGVECALLEDSAWFLWPLRWMVGVERKVRAVAQSITGAAADTYQMPDYLADDIKDWLQDDDVQEAFTRDSLVHKKLLEDLDRRPRWRPAELLKVCLDIGEPKASHSLRSES